MKEKNFQSHPNEKDQRWRHNLSRLQIILQSFSNQNSVVMAQKQTYRSMEENREQKETHVSIVNLSATKKSKGARTYDAEKTVSSLNGVGEVGQLHIIQSHYNTSLHSIQ